MRVRFAPSPTGRLHVGNARTALFNWLLARGSGQAFVLRVEDTDAERSTREFEASILADLRWLGIDWDEGPDRGGQMGPYRQSERLALYRASAGRLLAAGAAYHCFCSAAQLEADRRHALLAGGQAGYPGRCRAIDADAARERLAAGARAAVRLRVPDHREVFFDDLVRGRVAFHTSVIGDPVLLKSDGWPAYNFAVVVDDMAMGITHAIRGEDHLSNTPRQLLIYEALGHSAPRFAHLALVVGPDHTPLSKRHGATSVGELRDKGYLPEALVNYLALLGWSPGNHDEVLPVEELCQRFSLEAVGRSAAVFDEEKLSWLNRHYLRHAEPGRLVQLSLPYFERRGFVGAVDPVGREFLSTIMPMAAGSVDTVAEISDRVRFLFDFDPVAALQDAEVAIVTAEPGARDVIVALAEELGVTAPLDRERYRQMAGRVKARTGRKGKALFHPIRVALTGAAGGPELDVAVPAMERGARLPPSAGIASILSPLVRAKIFVAALGGPS